MGILRQGVNGSMTNKTGAIIGRVHRGQNVIVGLYRRGKRKRIMTENQTSAAYRFGLLSSFLSGITSFVKMGFKKMIKHNSPVNAALSYNYDHAFIVEDGVVRLNYPKLVYSIGDVEPPESPHLECTDGLMKLSWFNMPQSRFCQYTDTASVIVYEPLIDKRMAFRNVCPRSDLSVLLDVTPLIGSTVHCYVSFTSADGKLQGKNVYLGMLDV